MYTDKAAANMNIAAMRGEVFSGGAGGFDHIRLEFQINGGRKFLTTSSMELTQ